MKYYLKHLPLLVMVALYVIMACALASCSKDDDEPASDNLSSIIVGVWAQDGDDDIFVFNANGTGVIYESQVDYSEKKDGEDCTWSLKNDWFTIDLGDYTIQARPKSVTKNKIVWQEYDDYYVNDDDALRDSFGYYKIWTWERYPF